MTDQDALYDIATSDWHYAVRKMAVRRMDEAHLVRFAGKVPTQEYIRLCRPGNPQDDEVLAASLITSSEALADLYLLLKENRRDRARAKDEYPHWSGYGPKSKCEAALEERMGEAECAIAARKVLAGGGTVDPTGFLGTRILSPALRHELGIDLDKAELVAMFKEKPSGDVAKVLWPMLDERDVYTKPAITPPPNPSYSNFIIHTRDHHDHRAILRVREAAERRLRELNR